MSTVQQPFLTDVQELRRRSREQIEEGAVTSNYGCNIDKTVDILQHALATEILCVLRYSLHAIAAQGIDSESVKVTFREHAREEQEHMTRVAERINQLGGQPNFNPDGLISRAATEYGKAANLIEMIKEDLIAERIVIEHYRELIRYFSDNDPTTRILIESILSNEEEHANDMHDLLIAHEGKPFLKS